LSNRLLNFTLSCPLYYRAPYCRNSRRCDSSTFKACRTAEKFFGEDSYITNIQSAARNFNTEFDKFTQHFIVRLRSKEYLIGFNDCEILQFLARPPSDFRAFKDVCTENLYDVKMTSTGLLMMMS